MLITNTNLKTLFTGFSTAFSQAFENTASQASTVAMTVKSITTENEYAWLGQFPAMREWLGERHVKQLAAHGFRIKNRKFESTIEVRREDIEDDNFAIYAPMFQEMGRVAKQHPDTLLFSLMREGFSTNCYDGQYFFDNEHPLNP